MSEEQKLKAESLDERHFYEMLVLLRRDYELALAQIKILRAGPATMLTADQGIEFIDCTVSESTKP